MDRVKPDTLIVLFDSHTRVAHAMHEARKRYPNVMVIRHGANLTGHRFDKIFVFTQEPMDDYEAHCHYDFIHSYIDTKLKIGGKRIELVTDRRYPGKWRFYRWGSK